MRRVRRRVRAADSRVVTASARVDARSVFLRVRNSCQGKVLPLLPWQLSLQHPQGETAFVSQGCPWKWKIYWLTRVRKQWERRLMFAVFVQTAGFDCV